MWNFIKKHKIIFIIILVVVLGFGAYKIFFKPPSYTSFKVERQNLSETVELSGKVDVLKRADLHFQTGGLLTYLPFQEGDAVKQNQTIASLDQRQVKKTLTRYLNTYAVSRNTFEQGKDDNEQTILNDVNDEIKRILENNQYNLNNAVIDVELQDLALQYSKLTAPLSGIITNQTVKTTGVNVLVTDIFQIVDPSTLYFKANIDESDIARVEVGQKVIISLDAFPGKEFDSEIQSIAFASKETSTGTAFEAKFSLPIDEINNLRLGFNGTAKIILKEQPNVLSLPYEAVTQKGGDYHVMVKENGKYVDKTIETGIESDENIEIRSGLDEGQEVYVLNKTS